MEEVERVMISTISFIQAKAQHSIAASIILPRTVGVTGIYTALIQEPWYREGRSIGLIIPEYTLFSAIGIYIPRRLRACILARNMYSWTLSGFFFIGTW
jgi:hypothetical protein